jgi:nucleoside-diphosphate-sugar epimerase
LAAIPSVERALADPVRSHDANVTGTIKVMLAAERAGVRRVVYASSSSVYGVPAELPCRESMCPSPESPYGVTKLAAEHYVHVLGRNKGVETVALRYFNVFGPSQDPTSPYSAVIPKFVTAVLSGSRPTINGSGDTTRDFTFIDNVVWGNLLASTAAITSGSTYNIACGARISLLELLATICAIAGQAVEPLHGPPRPGDILHSQADISKARLELGYEVQTPFAQGMEVTVSWYAARTDPRDRWSE